MKSGCLKIGYAPIQVFKSTENRARRLNFRDAAPTTGKFNHEKKDVCGRRMTKYGEDGIGKMPVPSVTGDQIRGD